MMVTDTSFEKLCVRQTAHEGTAAAMPRAPLAPERPAAAGRVSPILFSAPMVRANIREVQQPGTGKTQTRRVAKWDRVEPGINLGFSGLSAARLRTNDTRDGVWTLSSRGRGGCWEERAWLRTFAVGDVLWVRETWAPLDALTHSDPGVTALADKGFYRADNSTVDGEIKRWQPSIHMPRWASRLTLEVTNVRVERLQDISEDDAIAEGVTKVRDCCYVIRGFDYDTSGLCHTHAVTPYAKLWEHLHGPGAWEANPWVVAVTYKPHLINVDAFLAQRATA